MNRTFLVLPFIVSALLAGCGTVPSTSPVDTGIEPSSGTYGYLDDGSGGDTTTDSGDTETDSDDTGSGLPETDTADTDSDTAISERIVAEVYFHEVTSSTDVCMYVANVSEGYWDEYGVAFCSTSDGSRGDGWLHQSVEYIPGQIVAANGEWSDGRYLAEAGNLLTNIDYAFVAFPDGTYEVYSIGTSTGVGDVAIYDGSYVSGGVTVNTQDFYFYTTDHTTGDYDLPDGM